MIKLNFALMSARSLAAIMAVGLGTLTLGVLIQGIFHDNRLEVMMAFGMLFSSVGMITNIQKGWGIVIIFTSFFGVGIMSHVLSEFLKVDILYTVRFFLTLAVIQILIMKFTKKHNLKFI